MESRTIWRGILFASKTPLLLVLDYGWASHPLAFGLTVSVSIWYFVYQITEWENEDMTVTHTDAGVSAHGRVIGSYGRSRNAFL